MAERCCMCLSAERRLTKVSPLHQQNMLLVCLDLKVVTWVCWECEARLSRLSTFRLQVAEAQRLLQQLPMGDSLKPLQSLSQLTHHHKSTFDASIIEDEYSAQNQIFIEVDNPSMKLENDEMKIETDFNYEPFDDHMNEIDEQECKIELKNYNLKQESDNLDNDNLYGDNQNDNINITVDNSYTSVKLKKSEVVEQREKQRQVKKYMIAPYKCETCITKHFSKEELKRHHKNLHNRKNEYECKICEQRFDNRILLKSHMRFHYYIYECNLCQYRTTNLRYIRLHFKTKHVIEHKCSQCSEICKTFPEFRRHMDDHREMRNCEVCGQEVKNRYFKTHMDIHKNLKSLCSICNKRFRNLDGHVKRMHVPVVVQEKAKGSNFPIPEENRYCIECDLKFSTKSGFMNHLRTSKRHAESEPRFECDECGRKWHSKHKLRAHVQRAHLAPAHAPPRCRYLDCRQVFSRREQLRAHLAAAHAHDAPPRDKLCPHCGKGFCTKRTLDNHILTHTGERPHRCPECDKGFTQKHCVATHLERAHGIVKKVETVFRVANKRFPCPECDMAYTKKQNLKWHLYKKHGYKQYDYSI